MEVTAKSPSDRKLGVSDAVRKAPGRRFRGFFYLFLIFLVLVIVAIAQGGVITGLRFKDPGGGELQVDISQGAGAEKGDSHAVQAQQSQLDERLTEIESRLKNQDTAQSSAVNISGSWHAGNGLIYQIQQYGDAIAFAEITPYGTTVTGQGQIVGDSIGGNFIAWNQTSGYVQLHVESPSVLSGTITNIALGTTFAIRMTK